MHSQYDLTHEAEELLAAFGERILPFGHAAAVCYATSVVSRTFGGRPTSVFDGQIAAICQAHGAEPATRNGKDFDHLGLNVIDPWNPEP